MRLNISAGAFLAALLCSFWLTGCGEREPTPEEQVRDYIVEGEAAAEGRELNRLKAMIASNYVDQAGRTQRDLVQLLAAYFFRHKSIHLLTRIEQLKIQDENQADVVLYVAMAASPITGVEQLLILRADLHRFELRLGRDEDGQWRLLRANWRQATLDDFRPQS